MNPELQSRIMRICDDKIAKKGENVGLSWWIKTHQLDHFEKALKIKRLVSAELQP